MAISFAITNPLTTLTLDQGRGELVFTVTNVSRYPVRGRAYLDVDLRDGVAAEWFDIADDDTRTFAPSETSVFTVEVVVPPNMPDAQPRVSLSMANVERPQEDFKAGPAVVVRGIAWKAEGPKRRWYQHWIWKVLLALILLGGIAFAVIMLMSGKGLQNMSLVDALTKVHEDQLDLGTVQWSFDPTLQEDRTILAPGTVLRSETTDTEVNIVIQIWHSFTTADELGTNSIERQESIKTITDKIPEQSKQNYPLSQWFTTQDADALAKARENNVPLDLWGERREVAYTDLQAENSDNTD